MLVRKTENQESRHVREGLTTALVLMLVAILVRAAVANPTDYLHYEVVEGLTGVDFGSWPSFFYTSGGGDGEIFAALGADPLGLDIAQSVPHIIYRYSRIGSSLLAAILSVGRDALLLPALAFIGLVSVGGVGFLAGYKRDRLGAKAWLLVLNPALLNGFIGDTAEPLAIFLLCLLLLGSKSFWVTVGLAVTRPTYAVSLVERGRLLVVAIAAAVAVRLYAWWRFSGSVLHSPESVFALPTAGYLAEISLTSLLVGLAASLTLVIGLLHRNWTWAASGLFVICLGPAVLSHPVNLVRAAGMLPVVWALIPVRSRNNSASHSLNKTAQAADVA